MSMFEVLDETTLPARINNLTPQLRADADAALADRKIRQATYSEDVVKSVDAIGRYVATLGRYTVQQRLVVKNGRQVVVWQVVDKRPARELTDAHKAAMKAGRAAAKAKKTAAEGNGHAPKVEHTRAPAKR